MTQHSRLVIIISTIMIVTVSSLQPLKTVQCHHQQQLRPQPIFRGIFFLTEITALTVHNELKLQ
jgi:hypothetical protein